MDTFVRSKPARPKGYGPKPKTATAALRQARKLLADEGRWIKGSEVEIDGWVVDYDDPFCGSWGACAIGAVGLVTGDILVAEEADEYTGTPTVCMLDIGQIAEPSAVYTEAVELLDMVARSIDTYVRWDGKQRPMWRSIVDYNDDGDRTRDEVLEQFDKAIRIGNRLRLATAKAVKAARAKVLEAAGVAA